MKFLLRVAGLVLFATLFAAAHGGSRVRAKLVSVHRAPNESSERVTQILLGDRVKVESVDGDWARIVVLDQYRLPQGYPGWVRLSELEKLGPPEGGEFVTVAYPVVHLRSEPSPQAEVVENVYLATRLPLAGRNRSAQVEGEEWLAVALPGTGRTAWVRGRQVAQERTLALGQGIAVVDKARLFKGTRYLWGGMSREGIDCSGLVYSVYRLYGTTLPRDADQQFEVGEAVKREDLEPGDMVFFGPSANDITHVGIYSGNGNFVHASSGRGVVENPLFEGWYLEHYQGARRVLREKPPETMILVPASSEGSR